MSNENKSLLNQREYIFLLLGFLLGLSFFKTQNILVEKSQQNSWISSGIGALIISAVKEVISCLTRKMF